MYLHILVGIVLYTSTTWGNCQMMLGNNVASNVSTTSTMQPTRSNGSQSVLAAGSNNTDCGDNCTLLETGDMWECQIVSGYPSVEPVGPKHYPLVPSYAYVWTTLNFSVFGRLKKIAYHAVTKGDIVLAIWRTPSVFNADQINPLDPTIQHRYLMEVVGKANVSCGSTCVVPGLNEYEFADKEKVWVSPKDYVGTIPSAYVFRNIMQSSKKYTWEYIDVLPYDTVLTADADLPPEDVTIPFGRAEQITYANSPVGSIFPFLFQPMTADESIYASPSLAITVECNCPLNCDGQCIVTTGDCLDCKSGWTGFQCIVPCVPHRWGKHCKQTCNVNCLHQICDPIFGYCSAGCQPGFVGMFCTTTCSAFVKPGYYLLNGTKGTELECGNCADEKPCDCNTGICVPGCAPGYQPPYCIHLCPSGFFGNNCQEICGNCLDPIAGCRPTDGHCIGGCKDGWMGDYCTIDKQCASQSTTSGILPFG